MSEEGGGQLRRNRRVADTYGLFDSLAPSARRTDPDTSHAAAAHRPSRVSQCGRLLEAIEGWGEHGATNGELEEQTGIRQCSLSRRLTDLKELGFIRDSGERRTGSSGSEQIVWVAK